MVMVVWELKLLEKWGIIVEILFWSYRYFDANGTLIKSNYFDLKSGEYFLENVAFKDSIFKNIRKTLLLLSLWLWSSEIICKGT